MTIFTTPTADQIEQADPAFDHNQPIPEIESVAAPLPAAPDRPRVQRRRSSGRDIFEFLLLLVGIYTLVNLATARAVVEGISMQPNFYTGQLIVVNRLVYYFSAPVRGDVIVLHDPEDPSQDFIKRIVGLPGEQIAIRDGRVYVNGTLLNEPYIPVFCTTCDGTWELDSDHYFVLGDNRPNSHDSHAFGPLDRRLIVGKAWIRYWPLSAIGLIPSQDYGTIPSQRPVAPPPTITPVPPLTPFTAPHSTPVRKPLNGSPGAV